MPKKKSNNKVEKFNYASEAYPPAEFADVVRVSYSVSNPIMMLSFGQTHPDRSETTMTREIVLPKDVCLSLKKLLDEHFKESK